MHEFLPQITMMLGLFGLMDLMIVIKWNTNYKGIENKAPSIITTMVGLFLEGGKVEGQQLFMGQRYIDLLLTFISIMCVPWMLCVKPYMLWKEHKEKSYERKFRGDVEMESINPYQEAPVSAFDDEYDMGVEKHRASEDEIMAAMGQKRGGHDFEIVEVAIH